MGISDRLITVANCLPSGGEEMCQGRAYLAACVMQGAALEGGLHAMCFLYPEDVKKTSIYQRKVKRGFRRKRNKALEFKYAELIDIADELLVPAQTGNVGEKDKPCGLRP